MSFVTTTPATMTCAATDLAAIGSRIDTANAAAAAVTTRLAAPAADEISTAIVALFNEHARSFQTLTARATALLDEFAVALQAGARSYAWVEAGNGSSMQELLGVAHASTQALGPSVIGSGITVGSAAGSAVSSIPKAMAAALAPATAMVMGGTGTPIPGQSYIDNVLEAFIKPNTAWAVPQGLATPEELYPYTGVLDLRFDISVSRGLTVLHNAISEHLAVGSHVTVFGYSQSATISSLEMRYLAALGSSAPSPDQLSFVLVANPNNPNGGLFARFAGLFVPSIGLTFSGATPADVYPTSVYTVEYDGIADFPRYPVNLLADLNALAGIYYLHGTVPYLTPEQVSGATILPTDGPTMSTYHMIRTPHLPLLYPLRGVPFIGNALADLMEPNLTTLVNLGYGDARYGYSTAPANLPTPFGLFPEVAPVTVLDLLVAGTQRGMDTAVYDITSAGLPALPDLSNWMAVADSLPAPVWPGFRTYIEISELHAANARLVAALGDIAATGYGTLSATRDMTLALVVTLPSYDLNLFLDGFGQFTAGDPLGLVNAVGYPLAATTGLLALGGGVELIVVFNALRAVAAELSALAA